MRVLLVEDEMFIAMMAEDMLLELGHTVETAMRLGPALAMARDLHADFALLDININGETSFAVATVLRERGIPFAFVTGYARNLVPEEFACEIILNKPYSSMEIAKLLAKAVPSRAG